MCEHYCLGSSSCWNRSWACPRRRKAFPWWYQTSSLLNYKGKRCQVSVELHNLRVVSESGELCSDSITLGRTHYECIGCLQLLLLLSFPGFLALRYSSSLSHHSHGMHLNPIYLSETRNHLMPSLPHSMCHTSHQGKVASTDIRFIFLGAQISHKGILGPDYSEWRE